MISFNLIPANLRVPGQYIEMDNTKANKGLSGMPTRVLVIGQKLAAGTQDELTPVLVTRPDQARALFGTGSQLAHMLEKFLAANSFTPVYAVAQDDLDAGVAATGTITFTGPSTAAGTASLYIGGRRVRFAIAAGATAAQMATACAAAITADTDLPVTAAVDGEVTTQVNLSARHKGECANAIDIRFNYYADEKLPAGATAAVVALAGGTGNPDIEDVLDAIGDEWFTDIVMPYTDATNLSAMEDALGNRFGPMKMIDGHLYTHIEGTHGQLVTKGTGRNSPHNSWMGSRRSPSPPYEWAAVLGAVCSFALHNDPARPVQTLELPGILPPVVADRFTLEERNLLLYSGVSTFRVDAGGNVVIERVVTTYRENAFGAADPSYLNIETLKTISYLRYDTRNHIAVTYPRYKLADDGTRFARGQAVVTPSVIRATLIARALMWEEQGLVENVDQFKQDLIVERNANDPDRVDAIIPPDIVNGFRVFAALQQFRV